MSVLGRIRGHIFSNFFYHKFENTPVEQWNHIIDQQFFLLKKEKMNWKLPKTIDQKIQWLKLNDDSELRTRLTDKYAVRSWVKDKIGEEYLVKLLGKWDTAEDIDYNNLPDKFVLKANHGCGCNYIVLDKTKVDRKDVNRKFKKWLSINYAYLCGELQYKNIKPCIIAEEYIADLDGEIPDYKVWCFNGKAEYVMYLSERTKGLKMAFYNREWEKQDFVYSYPKNESIIPRPEQLEKLISLAEILSEGFYHVRVDFYILKNGQIKFGEMTFSSAGGKSKWNPPEADFKLGSLLKLPTDKG